MAQATLTINADGSGALSTINAIQQALNNLQNSANNINIGGNGNGNGGGNQIDNMGNGIARLTLLTNSWAAAITRTVAAALKNAYKEINNIDDELVTVRRVTGRTGEEIDALTQKSTKVAKQYGVAASDYLASVANFSKAGYGQAADALGELSIKAQRVGDLTQDVADQFLLAVDKGYQFGGSIEQLSAVLDGANEIGNKFATDVDQIAAGLGKVAPIANQAHVSIYELEAALGTITAVTQRSGTEAATALRALFLNIMGDTKTEIEDGAKWTAGEIEGLQDLLKIYASDVVEAAQKTGEVINPMEAIAALSKAYREGVLTEQSLVSMVSDIGGKLRTTQLLALIQNWDMYTKMVETAENATGSADKEIENSLDSITVKTQQLKATWVDMVNKTMSSRFIKNTLDFSKSLLESFGDLRGVLMGVSGILLTLRGADITRGFQNIFAGLRAGGMRSVLTGIGVATTALTGLMMAVNYASQGGLQKATGFAETATNAAKASDGIYEMYAAVQSATPGTEAYSAALARLGAQLETTGGSAKGLADNLQQVTEAQLDNLRVTTSAAYNEISALIAKNAFFGWGNPLNGMETQMGIAAGYYNFSTRNIADARIRQVIEDNLASLSLGRDFYGLANHNAQDISFRDADQLITTYETLVQTRDEIRGLVERGVVDNTNNSVYSSEYYNDITSMLNVLTATYEQARSALDSNIATTTNLEKARFEVNEYAESWAELNKQIVDGGQASGTERIAAMRQMIHFVDEFAKDGSLLGKGVRTNMILHLAELFPELASGIQEWQDILAQHGKNGVAEGAEEATGAVKALADALSAATKAKNEFDAAMAKKAENADFTDYKSAYEAYATEIKEGRVNSQTAHAAARYLMGAEAYDAAMAAGGYKSVNAAMKNSHFELLYGEKAGDYGEGLIPFMKKYANSAGEIIDANGNLLASIQQTSDGMQLQINDFQGLADAMSLPIGQLSGAVRALGVYGEIAMPEIEGMKEALSELQGIAGEDENGIFSVDYNALLSSMTDEQLQSGYWQSLKEYLNLANELGEISLKNVTEGWLEADDAAERAAASAKQASEAPNTTAEAVDEVGESADDAAEQVEELNDTVNEVLEKGEGGGGEAGSTFEGIVEQFLTDALTELLGSENATSFIQDPGAFFGNVWENVSNDLNTWFTGVLAELLGEENAQSFMKDPGAFLSTAWDNVSNDFNTWFSGVLTELFGEDGAQSFLKDPGAFLSTAWDNVSADFSTWFSGVLTELFGEDGAQSFLKDPGAFLSTAWDNVSADFNTWFSSVLTELFGEDGAQSFLKDPGAFLSTAWDNVSADFSTWFSGVLTELFGEEKAQSFIKDAGAFLSTTWDNVSADFSTWFSGVLTELLGEDNAQSFMKDPGAFLSTTWDNVSADFSTWFSGVLTELFGEENAKSFIKDPGKFAADQISKVQEWFSSTIDSLFADITTGIEGLSGFADGIAQKIEDWFNGIIESFIGGAKESTSPEMSEEDQALRDYLDESRKDGDDQAALDAKYFNPNVYSGTEDDILGLNEALDATGEAAEEAGTAIETAAEAQRDLNEAQTPEPAPGPPPSPAPTPGPTPGPSTTASGGNPAVQEVQVKASGDAEEISGIIEANGKTVKVKADVKAGDDAEQITQALASEVDSTTIEKEIHVTVADDTREALDGIISKDFDNAQEVDVSFNIKTTGDGQQILSMIQSGTINGVPSQITTTFTVDGDGQAQVEEIKGELDSVSGSYSANVSVKASGEDALSRLKSAIAAISDKTVTVTAKTNGGTGTGSSTSTTSTFGGNVLNWFKNALGMSANAKGTSSFKGGLSLINEEGPELVTADGWARILGGGKPTIANIPRGASIFTAKETARMLGSAYRGQTEFRAFASGTDWLSKLGNLWENVQKSGKPSTNLGVQSRPTASASGTLSLPKSGSSSAPVDAIPERSGEWGNIPPSVQKKIDADRKSAADAAEEAEEYSFWDVIKSYIDYGLKKIQYQIDDRQEAIEALERERDKLFKPLDKDIDNYNWEIDEAKYRIKLLERSRDDATKGLKDQIDALKEAREIEQDEEEIEERRLALIEAENALKDAQYDRTVRYFNEASGQWEWGVDRSAVKQAEDALKNARDAYEDALADYEISELERQVEAIEKMYALQMEPYETTVEQFTRKVEDLQHQRDKIDKQYADSIEPLQDAMDEVQLTYDKLAKYYSRLQDAVSVPTDNLNVALTAMSQAESAYSSQTGNARTLLDALYTLAPTWSAIPVGSLGVNTASAVSTPATYTIGTDSQGGIDFKKLLEGSGVGQTIVINGLTVKGDGNMSLNELMDKAGIYRNASK